MSKWMGGRKGLWAEMNVYVSAPPRPKCPIGTIQAKRGDTTTSSKPFPRCPEARNRKTRIDMLIIDFAPLSTKHALNKR